MSDPPERFAERFLRAWQLYERTAGTGRVQAKDFAAALRVPPSNITAWMAADESPPAHRVRRIARVTGTDPGWLAFGSDCQAPMRKAWPAETVSAPPVHHGVPVSQVRGVPVAEHLAAKQPRKQAGKGKR